MVLWVAFAQAAQCVRGETKTGGFLQVESYFEASDRSESLLLNI